MRSPKLVCGVGVNDADYLIVRHEKTDYTGGKRKLVWLCPFYLTWTNMLKRAYSPKYHEKYPTYIGCSVSEDWLLFSNFRAWMEEQDYEGKHLDKDILLPGNKHYSKESCIFVPQVVNKFIVEGSANRGSFPIGTCWSKEKQKFIAQCSNPFTGKREHLGYYACPNEAHVAWLKRKQELAALLADEQTDRRIAEALVARYVNYHTGE